MNNTSTLTEIAAILMAATLVVGGTLAAASAQSVFPLPNIGAQNDGKGGNGGGVHPGGGGVHPGGGGGGGVHPGGGGGRSVAEVMAVVAIMVKEEAVAIMVKEAAMVMAAMATALSNLANKLSQVYFHKNRSTILKQLP